MFSDKKHELEASNWVKILATKSSPQTLGATNVLRPLCNTHDLGSCKKPKKSLLKSFKLHSQTPFMLYRLEPHLK